MSVPPLPSRGNVSPRTQALPSIKSPRAHSHFKAPTLLSTHRHTPSKREILLNYHNDLESLAKLEETRQAELKRRTIDQKALTSRGGSVKSMNADAVEGFSTVKAVSPSSARVIPSSTLLAKGIDNESVPSLSAAPVSALRPPPPAQCSPFPDPSLELGREQIRLSTNTTALRGQPTQSNPFPSDPSSSEYEELKQRIAAYEARYQRGHLQRRMTTVLRNPAALSGSVVDIGNSSSTSPGRLITVPSALPLPNALPSEAIQEAFDALKFSFSTQITSKSRDKATEERNAATQTEEKEKQRLAELHAENERRLDAALLADRLKRSLLPKYCQAVRYHIGASNDESTRPRWMTDATGGLQGASTSPTSNAGPTIAAVAIGSGGGGGEEATLSRSFAVASAGSPFGDGFGSSPFAEGSVGEDEWTRRRGDEGLKHKRSLNEIIRWLMDSAERRIQKVSTPADGSIAEHKEDGAGWYLFRCFELCCDLCNFVLCKILPPEVFVGDGERYKRLVEMAKSSIETEANRREPDYDVVKGGEGTLKSSKDDPNDPNESRANKPAEGAMTTSVAHKNGESASQHNQEKEKDQFFLTRVPQPPSLHPSSSHGVLAVRPPDVERKQSTRLRAERALTGVAKARLQELMPTTGLGDAPEVLSNLESEGLALGPDGGDSESGRRSSASPHTHGKKKHLSSIKQTLQAAADRHGLWLSLGSPRLAHPPLHACAHIEGRHLRDAQKYRRQVVALTGGQPLQFSMSDGTETSAAAKSKLTADHVARNAVTDIEDFHKPDDTILPIVELLQDMAWAMESSIDASVTICSESDARPSVRRHLTSRQTGAIEGSLLYEIANAYCSFVKAISDPELRAIRQPHADGRRKRNSHGTEENAAEEPAKSVYTNTQAQTQSPLATPLATPKCAFAKRYMIVSAAPRVIIDATIAYLRTLITPPTEATLRAERRHRKLLEYSITGEFRPAKANEGSVREVATEEAGIREELSHTESSASSSVTTKGTPNEATLKLLQAAASAAATSQQEKERLELLTKEQDDQLRSEVMLRLRGELLFLFTGVDERTLMLDEHQRKERHRWEALDARRRQRQQQALSGKTGLMLGGASSVAGGSGTTATAPSYVPSEAALSLSKRSSPSTTPRRSPSRSQGGHMIHMSLNTQASGNSPISLGLAAPNAGGGTKGKSPAPSHLSAVSKSSRDGGVASNRNDSLGASPLSAARRRSSFNIGGAKPSSSNSKGLLSPANVYTHSIALMMDDLRREDEEAVASMMLLSTKCGGVSVSGVTELTHQARLRQHKRQADARRDSRGASLLVSSGKEDELADEGKTAMSSSRRLTAGPEVNCAKSGQGAQTTSTTANACGSSAVSGGGIRIVIEDTSGMGGDMDDIEAPNVFPRPPKAAVFDWQNAHSAVPAVGAGTGTNGGTGTGTGRSTRPEVSPNATFLRHTASSAKSALASTTSSSGPAPVKQLRFAGIPPEDDDRHQKSTSRGEEDSAPGSTLQSPTRRGRSTSIVVQHLTSRNGGLNSSSSISNAAGYSASQQREANPFLVTRKDEEREVMSLATELLKLERHRRRHNPTIGLANASVQLEKERAREKEEAQQASGGPQSAEGGFSVANEERSAAIFDNRTLSAGVGMLEKANNLEGFEPHEGGRESGASAKDAKGTGDGIRTSYEKDVVPHDIELARTFMALHTGDALAGQKGGGMSVRKAKAKNAPQLQMISKTHTSLSSSLVSALVGDDGPKRAGNPAAVSTPSSPRHPNVAKPSQNAQNNIGGLSMVGPDGAGPVLGHYQYHDGDGHYYFPLDTGVIKTNPKTGEQSRVVKLVSVTQSVVGAKEAEAVERFKLACRQTLPGHDLMRRWYEYKTSEGAFRKYKDEKKDTITIEAEKHLTNAAQPSGSTNTLQRGTFDVHGTSPLTVLWSLANETRQGSGGFGFGRKGKPLTINWTF